ncbi:MAG: hypothetical protein RLZZ471_850 [Actinomycetota bacterium]
MNIDLHLLGEISGFIGGAIGVATGVPQSLRVRKLGHTDGLALSPWILMCIQFAAWTAFGLSHNALAIWFFNALTFVTTALVVIAIRGNKFSTYALLIVIAAVTGAFVFYGPEALINVVMVALTASRVPQLIRSWINRKRTKPTAVSISSLLVSLTSYLFWLGFAFLTENSLVIVTTFVAIGVTLATALLEQHIAKRAVA